MPHPHADLIHTFYAAFQRHDHQTMAACYTADARFSDPVFLDLAGERIGAMWRMLCERAADLQIDLSNVSVDADTGSAHWEARYTFTATGRPVHNVIDAAFRFSGGKFHRHTDRFGLYAWTRQALGVKGLLLGWTPLVQGAVRRQAARSLDAFLSRANPRPHRE